MKAETDLCGDLEPRSAVLPFKLGGKNLIVRELPLYQRGVVVKMICNSAAKILGAIDKAGGRASLLSIIGSGESDKIVDAISKVVAELNDEIDQIVCGILASTENASALGLIEPDEVRCTDEAMTTLAGIASLEMTTRQQVYTLKAYAEVEGLKELLGNLATLSTKVSGMVDSEAETTE